MNLCMRRPLDPTRLFAHVNPYFQRSRDSTGRYTSTCYILLLALALALSAFDPPRAIYTISLNL